MFIVHPRSPRPTRDSFSIALLAASFLFLWTGQRAIASPLTGSWYLNDSNSSTFPSGTNYAQVSLTVDDSDKVTFNVSLLSNLTSNGYSGDKFAFNWAGSSNISSQLSTAIANASSPLNNWSVKGSNGSPSEQMGGMGKYNYEISAHGAGNRTIPLSFTMDLSGLGLTQSQILSDFQVTSSGANGSGYFALHTAKSGNSFYLGGSDPVATPEPNSLVLMGITGGLLLCVFFGRVALQSLRHVPAASLLRADS